MNYAGKFGSGGLDSFSSADLHLDSLSHRGGGNTVTVPDAHLLFSGDYQRSGHDLIVSDHDHRFVVQNYFHGDKRPGLVSPEGAPLDPKVIEALTGHAEYAQAGGVPAAKVVGHVVKMSGSASVVRNGVTVVLNNGDAVYQSDVVQTGSGSTLGLVLDDGTTFNLSANARLMLNDLTYDATSNSNSSLITLVQGAASFVAGQVAKTGDMKVATPVATMGIRGTAVILDISSVDGKVSISVVDQHDGLVHSVQVFNAQGILIGTVTSSGTGLTLTPAANFEVIAQESNKTVAQVTQEFSAFQTLLQTYDVGKQMFPNLPQHTENGGGDKNNPTPGTKAAQGSPSPGSPETVVTGVTGGAPPPATTTPVNILVTSNPPAGGAPGGSPTITPSDPVVVLDKVIPVTPLPFVVTPATTASITSGTGDHTGPAMSAQGDVVYDPDGIVYFYDRESHTTIRVSDNDGRTYSGQTISSDGRYIVYQGTDGTDTSVFVYGTDPTDATHYHVQTRLVAGTSPAISGDGSAILVEQGGSIGVYDLQGHVIATITPAATGVAGTLWKPSISADGHIVTFWSSDTPGPGGAGHLFAYNVSTGAVTDVVSVASGAGQHAASISADGHFVVYQGLSAGGQSQIYLFDLNLGHVVFSTDDAAGASRNPVISPDGHYIIFTSDAQLDPAGDVNAFADTYVVDVTNPAAPVYSLVSENSNAASDGGVAISAGGLYVAFASNASFSPLSDPGSNQIFFADPTSGRSAFIRETVNSPDQLQAGGTIALTGDLSGITITAVDPTGRFTIDPTPDANGRITWHFSEAKSDFASLQPGQISIQNFTITLANGVSTTTIPVRVSVYDADQPVVAVVTNPGSIVGDGGNNTLTGTLGNDIFQGFGGDDTLIGLTGVDRAVYTDATGGIIVNLSFTGGIASGAVTGAGVGTDTLVGIEAIQGSNFTDHYTATGFVSDAGVPGVPPGFNSFEGMAGDDIITGNTNAQGQILTRISYASSTGAVNVDFSTGNATGNSSVGHDHFTNVNAVIGSSYGDTLIGSDNPNGTYEQFDGRGGNDTIDGRGGYDFASYNNDPATHSGITVNLAAGANNVVGDASIGSDTFHSVEAVRGTNFADTYDARNFGATGFTDPATHNVGSLGTFNNFDGVGGDDIIYGNGNTRIQYTQSLAGVFVDLADSSAGGTGVARDRADATNHTHFDLASMGVDSIRGGVNAVMGSMFADALYGSAGNDTFQGLAGDDFIDGRGGFDTAQYNNMTYTTGGISVEMALGRVTGDASNGVDTLRSIEIVQGTNFNDSYDATGFGDANHADPLAFNVGSSGTFNQFEGLAGNDQITGNGATRASYGTASAGVSITITGAGAGHGQDRLDAQNGTHADLAGVGYDTFVSGVAGGVGSNFDDIYDASGFTGQFNAFQGLDGDDQIIGNGFTQVVFSSATAGVTVDLVTGTSHGTASGDLANVGNDTFTGVSAIFGSNFADTLLGNSAANAISGQGGNDLIDGRGGFDALTGGAGADTFVYGAAYGAATITDFSHGEGDRIDLTGVPFVHSLSELLSYAHPSGPGGINTLIDFDNGNTLTLNNVTSTSLVAADFIFSAAPNHPPAVTAGDGDSAGTATPLAETDSTLTAQGTLTVTDADSTDSVSVSVSGVTHTGPTGGLSDNALLSYFHVPGTAVLSPGQTSAHFTWNFDSSGQAFNYLAAGETLTLHYTIVPSDGHAPAGTGNGVVTIDIAGTNDAPAFDGASAGTNSVNGAAVAVAGNVTASDIDSANYAGGSFSATVTAGGNEGDTLSIADNAHIFITSGSHVMFDIDGPGGADAVEIGDLADNTDHVNSVTVHLNANATDAAVEALAEAIQYANVKADPATGTRTVTFSLQDGGGTAGGVLDSDFFDATVNVTHLNHPATFGGDTTGSVIEDGLLVTSGGNIPLDTDSGRLTVQDVDSGEDHFQPVATGSLVGLYGDFTFNENTGDWTYTLNHGRADSLTGTDVVHDRLTVTSTDGTTQVIDVTVNGTNDAPAVSGPVTGAATEDGSPVSLNALANASDVDDGTLSVVNLPGSLPNGVSYDSATHSFTLDPTHPVFDQLAAGAPTTVTVNYGVSDGHVTTAASVSWTVTGVNDAPSLDSAALDPVAEDAIAEDIAGATVQDLFAQEFSDIDNGSSMAGVAITANHATPEQGVWQYMTPTSGIWEDVGSPDLAHALAFSADTLLRFVPAANFNGAPGSLEAYAIDNTYDEEFTVGSVPGGERYTINLTDEGDEPLGHGGTTPFSADPASLSTSVTAVNDAPVVDLDPAVDGYDYTANVSNNGDAFPIAVSPAVSDVDNTELSSATVVLTDGEVGDSFTLGSGGSSGTLPGGISWLISGVAGNATDPLKVTFSGSFSAADIASAIEQVSFGTTSLVLGPRHITVTVNDGSADSNVATANIEVTAAPPPDNNAPTIDATNWIELVSTDSDGLQGNDGSFAGPVSAGGRFVAFNSDADNLLGDDNDNNGAADIFVHDQVTGVTERVSVSTLGGDADGASGDIAMTPDGSFVVFDSAAHNLVSPATHNSSDVFVYNRFLHTAEQISVDSDENPLQGASQSSAHAVSDDGRYVVFETMASAAAADTNNTWDIYVRDRDAETTTLVSGNQAGSSGNGPSNYAVISGDGRYVAFNSAVENLDGSGVDHDGARDVYVRDLELGTTTLVSSGQSGDSAAYAISADGRFVLYTSVDVASPDDLFLFVRDMQNNTTTQIVEESASSFTSADISADGRYVVFSNQTADGGTGVFVYDAQTQLTMQVSVNAEGHDSGNTFSGYPSISADGRFVSFESDATNLVDSDNNEASDVFTVDLAAPARTVHDNADSGTIATFGEIAFSDPDTTDTHTATVLPTTGVHFGTFALDADVAETDGHGTLGWNFRVDHSEIAHLSAGQTATQSYTVEIDDDHGGKTFQTIDVTIVGVNDAPVLAGDENVQFDPILASAVDNEGQTVGSLLNGDVTDPDGPATGIAITDNEVTGGASAGHWEYRLDSGGGWTTFNASEDSALLLGVDDHVRFVPNNGQAGTQSLAFHAWDGSSGTAGDQVDLQAAGTGGSTAFSSNFNSADIVVTAAADDVAPTVTGDMSVLTVKNGHEVQVTAADLGATDPDTDADHLVFTVEHLNHGSLAIGPNRAPLEVDDTFTLADVQAGRVYYSSVGDYTGADHISLLLSDSVAGTPPVSVILGGTIVDAQFTVVTPDGYDFEAKNPVAAMGAGRIDPTSESQTGFTIFANDQRHYVFTGLGLQYGSGVNGDTVTGGVITSITELGPLDQNNVRPELAKFDLYVSATDWYNGTVTAAAGDNSLMEALVSQWTFNFIGAAGADAFRPGDNNDIFTGRAGNDTLVGEFGYDRANYGGATAAIDVHLAAGDVFGDGSVDHDTLQSVELVTGSNYDDTFDATGFSSSSTNAGSTVTNNVLGQFNEFEGRAGTDTITGNGQTRISYYHATAGVTVTFDSNSWLPATNPFGGASGTATGNTASVGTDHFTGVNQVRGSFFDDTFHGSTNPAGFAENFEGMGGDDLIDGGGGFDRAYYFSAADGTGITVNLAAGTVDGGIDTGHDTLVSVEGIWGTDYADIYNAAGFSTTSTNAGSNQNSNGVGVNDFNEFEGGGGNDTVIGNGNTRIAFYHATSGVVVTLGENLDPNSPIGHGTAVGALISTGTDDLVSGITRVRGSEFNDIITGNSAANTLEGQGGNDVLRGLGGNDVLTGGTGADIFVYDVGGGSDRITDFHRGEGDRIDLRAFSSIHSTGNLIFTAGTFDPSTNTFTAGAGGADTRISGFGSGNTITVLGVASTSFVPSDFIFSSAAGSSVAVTVQTPDGYDFSTLYDDMATGNPNQASNDSNHIFVHATGKTFELIGNSIWNTTTHQPTAGLITDIVILDSADPTQVTQDHVLVNSNGWSIGASALFSGINQYASSDPATHAAGLTALNAIFNAATYNIVGSGGGPGGHHDPQTGADTFFGGDHADVFNGMPGQSGPQDPGNDTVDYSHASSAVTVNLSTHATGGAAAGDTFISIENLRGSDFGDTLTGDGNNNVIEGGLGDDTLVGGPGDTLSYEHASDYVTVNLASTVSQDTHSAGHDTISGFSILLGSSHDDFLAGGGSSFIEGGAGNDHITGAPASSITASYEHAAAGVTVSLNNTAAQNTIGAGVDTLSNVANLFGSHFSDHLTGNNNANILDGGYGGSEVHDVLTGLGGADTFVFNTGHVTITDFTQNEDHVDISHANFGTGFTDAQLNALIAASTGDSIDFGNNNVLTFANVANVSAYLHASDFLH